MLGATVGRAARSATPTVVPPGSCRQSAPRSELGCHRRRPRPICRDIGGQLGAARGRWEAPGGEGCTQWSDVKPSGPDVQFAPKTITRRYGPGSWVEHGPGNGDSTWSGRRTAYIVGFLDELLDRGRGGADGMCPRKGKRCSPGHRRCVWRGATARTCPGVGGAHPAWRGLPQWHVAMHSVGEGGEG